MCRPGDINFIKKDIAFALKRYPKLTVVEKSGHLPALKGIIDLCDRETGRLIDSINMLLQYTNRFPYGYLLASELGSRFSKFNDDMHVNGDGSLCLGTPQVEFIQTRNGLLTLPFIDTVLIPNLAWRLAMLDNPEINLKANSHGVLGILEGYLEMLETKDEKLTIKFLQGYVRGSVPQRNETCPCNSGKKFKNCHGLYLSKVGLLPKGIVAQHINQILTFLNLRESRSHPNLNK